ncbi:MAG: GNAT family N-acetyltransferase [Polyangiaceae bacterium]
MPPSTKLELSIRPATLEDVPRLVAMNHAAYPELVEANVVWSEEQLRAHLARFPEGQLVATRRDGAGREEILGAISTFIVPPGRDPMAQHTWLDITDDGTFASHDPRGDTLYLADVYVDPAGWGKGVSERLYAALKDTCVALGLRRVVAGGRLWGFHEYAGVLTAREYVERALHGEIRDRVLGSQLKAGFAVRGILEGYLRDPRSGDYATLLEWVAPRA